MKIAQIAPLMESVPPRLYGGTERIVSYLTEELVALGHDVTLFASGNSITAANLVPCVPKALRLDASVRDPIPYYMLMLDRVRQRADDFDVLHFHIDQFHFPLFRPIAGRTVTTLHGRQDLPDLLPLYLGFDDMPLVSISNDAAPPGAECELRGDRLSRPAASTCIAPSRSRAAAISPFSAASRRKSAPTAPSRSRARSAFRSRSPPRWTASTRPISGRRSSRCSTARASSSSARSTSTRRRSSWARRRRCCSRSTGRSRSASSMIEAMACGTPVLAFRCGSVPEIIEDGITGAIVDTMEEAIAALPHVIALDRKKVRQRFEQRFSATRMAQRIMLTSIVRCSSRRKSVDSGQRDRPTSLAERQGFDRPEASHCLGSNSTATLVEEIPETRSTFRRQDPPRGRAALSSMAIASPCSTAMRDIGASPGGPDGIFFCDTRYLSHLEMLLNGKQPLLLGSNVRDDNSILTVDLTNPDIYVDQKLVQPKDMLHIVRTLFLWHGTAYQRLRIQNHGDQPVRRPARSPSPATSPTCSRCADCAARAAAPRPRKSAATPRCAELSRPRRQTAAHDAAVRACAGAALQQRRSLRFRAAAQRKPVDLRDGEVRPRRRRKHALCHFARACARRSTSTGPRAAASPRSPASNQIFNEVVCRSMADLAMLTTSTPQGPYPYAGIPWYSTTFGRDGIITAMQMLWCDPASPRACCGGWPPIRPTTSMPLADAEPGKILHEMRGGEMAALREVPFGLYYGSVDATPLFVMLAGLYAEHTGDIETLRELWPNIEAALDWIDGPGDPDRDGFVEYHRADENGLVNQGWKDSHDAIFHADGTLAQGPIALCEVQGYVYAAKRLAARGRAPARQDRARRHARCAGRRSSPNDSKRHSGARTSALMRSRSTAQKRPCRVRTSNAGQVLFSGIAAPERAEAVMRDLMRPSFFSGWGIRTVAREEPRYNPMSYHNGSVWPHDNSLIARGLRALRAQERGRSCVQGPVRRRHLHGPAAAARAVLRLPARAPARADALSRRLLAAGLGRRHAASAPAIVSRSRIRFRPQRNPVAQPSAAIVSRSGDAAQPASRQALRST